MSFTEHVRTFGRDCDPVGCVLPRLNRLLRARMRRRNLLDAPPRYLGYAFPNWNDDDAFEELVFDCYLFAVARRIRGLQRQLRARTNIDGCICRNVDNFLTERQRRRDPVGYAVFGNVEAAAGELCAANQLTVEGHANGRIQNASILHLDARQANGDPCEPGRLQSAVAEASDWRDSLESLTSTTAEGCAWVVALLQRLRAAGTLHVRVVDLVHAIATRARDDWQALHATPAGELAFEGDDELLTITRIVRPVDRTEWTDTLRNLRLAVLERIARERQQRVRERLTAVFDEMIRMLEETDFAQLEQTALADRLDMPDATLSDYLRRLRRILAEILPETRSAADSGG
jgi:hypothetical protein